MRHHRVSRCDPYVLDFVTWSVMKGCRLFGRVRVDRRVGLIATDHIPEYDFVSLTPAEATQSVLTVIQDLKFPPLCNANTFDDKTPFGTHLNRGSFSFICYLAVALLTGRPDGLECYLRVLPVEKNAPMELAAREITKMPAFSVWTAPLREVPGYSNRFHDAFCYAFSLFHRHAIPLWSSSAATHAMPFFSSSPLARPFHKSDSGGARDLEAGSGEVMGLAPLVDLATHSPAPNAGIGYPDEEMLRWIQQERSIKKMPTKGCIVLQALRDIYPGDLVTVNKNSLFHLDEKAFESWFGIPFIPPGEPIPNGTEEQTNMDDCSANAFLDPTALEPYT